MLNRAALQSTITGVNANLKATGLQVKGGIADAEARADQARDTATEERNQSFWQDGLKLAGTVATTALLASDKTIKDNIQNIEDALGKLRQLRPVTLITRKNQVSSRLHHGFIAQEYKEVMPDATYHDEEYGKYCIDTADLIGLLVRAVQQLEIKSPVLKPLTHQQECVTPEENNTAAYPETLAPVLGGALDFAGAALGFVDDAVSRLLNFKMHQ